MKDSDLKYLAALEQEIEDLEPEFPECSKAPKDCQNEEGWWPDLNEPQMEMFNDYTRNLLLTSERFCLSPDSIVYTGNGLRRLRSFEPANSHENAARLTDGNVTSFNTESLSTRTSNVSHYWKSTNVEARSVTLEHGKVLTTSPNHPIWCCVDDGENFEFKWVMVDEIRDGIKDGVKFHTPFMGHPSFTKDEYKVWRDVVIDEKVAYAVGALIGDGCMTQRHNMTITSIDQEIFRQVGEGIAAFGAVLRPQKKPITHSINSSSKLRDFIVENKLNCTSYYKRVPEVFFDSRRSVIIALLRGLYDTDGTAEKTGTVSFSSSSEGLTNDVQSLLGALGIIGAKRYRKTPKAPSWNIVSAGENALLFFDIVGFSLDRKQCRRRDPKFSNRKKYGYPKAICRVLTSRIKTVGNPDVFQRKPVSHVKPKKIQRKRGKVVWEINRTLHQSHPTKRENLYFLGDEMGAKEFAKEANKKIDQINKRLRGRDWHRSNRGATNFYRGEIPNSEKLQKILELYDEDGSIRESIKPFLVADRWIEVVSVEEATSDLADLIVPGDESFISEGIIHHNSGKSYSVAHKAVRHAWETWDALVLITTYSLEGLTSGLMEDLVNEILPDWERNVGLEWVGPKQNISKTTFIKIANRFGGWSTIMFKPCPTTTIISTRFKPIKASLIIFEEMGDQNDKDYYTKLNQQLRRNYVKHPQFIAVTNPPPEGPKHYLYEMFFVEPEDEQEAERWRKKYKRIHFPARLNKWRDVESYLEDITFDNRGDQNTIDRLVKGEWVERQTGTGIFADYFIPEIHIKGSLESNRRIIAQPSMPIVLGGDMGDVNNGFAFLQQAHLKDKVVWLMLAELETVGKKLSNPQLMHLLLTKMNSVVADGAQSKGYDISQAVENFRYDHIADSSTLRFRRDGGDIERELIKQETTRILKEHANQYPYIKEPVYFKPAPKGDGSVEFRVKMLIEMLQTERFFVDASCVRTIEMFKKITSSTKAGASPFTPGDRSKYKHILDAITYPIVFHAVRGDAVPEERRVKPKYY